ncbi:mitochondrial 37S ribosomal protein uS4m [Calcarisporiella thermophila]|uniref:mitochondrial 37S ribosomal protein uS4m n=1 Tax=Calcarisporiella thermophila TaxID=911321 RepID=UPI0037429A89
MVRKPPFSLSRALPRMSWNKYNLYNIAKNRANPPELSNKTLFQQKWLSKRLTRAYHGDELSERQFTKLFKSKLPTVTGITVEGGANTPVASLAVAELERRLDFIVFRCHFAPSVYAARQLCTHGKVMVNGKKMSYPSHLVRDGDIITVQPSAISMLARPNQQPGASTEEVKSESEQNTDANSTSLKSRKDGWDVEHEFKYKPYSQPFMFIPDYLEVDYKACSAVFLRSPVARPGRTEIPTPFPSEIHALAHEFYARNRK